MVILVDIALQQTFTLIVTANFSPMEVFNLKLQGAVDWGRKALKRGLYSECEADLRMSLRSLTKHSRCYSLARLSVCLESPMALLGLFL
jgi:hypothetical protein